MKKNDPPVAQKRVLHLIASLDPEKGGVSTAVRMIIKGLIKFNVYNEIACLDNPDASYLKNDSYTIQALGPGKGPWNYNKKLLPWLTENLRRFDIIILHGLWLYIGYATEKAIALYIKNQKGIHTEEIPKFYVMPHGMLDPYFQRSPKRKIKAIRNWIYWKLIEKNIVNNSDGLFFTCKEELLSAKIPFSPYLPKKELVIGLGIENPPAYTPAMKEYFLEKCPGLTGPYILFLGRIHDKKGIDLLLNAYNRQFGMLSQNSSEINGQVADSGSIPQLVIAGPNKESDYGKKIQKLIDGNEFLKKNVLLPGMLEGNAKWGSYYGSEAFVLTSHQENFGISIVEAMSCGIPVLISNKVNIWREIYESDAGLISENTQEGVNELIKKWKFSDVSTRKTMSLHATKCYEQYFSIDSAIHCLLENII